MPPFGLPHMKKTLILRFFFPSYLHKTLKRDRFHLILQVTQDFKYNKHNFKSLMGHD